MSLDVFIVKEPILGCIRTLFPIWVWNAHLLAHMKILSRTPLIFVLEDELPKMPLMSHTYTYHVLHLYRYRLVG